MWQSRKVAKSTQFLFKQILWLTSLQKFYFSDAAMHLKTLSHPKSRITNVEATVVQHFKIAVRQERAVIVPALTFLLLFVSRQKVNNKSA